MSSLRPLITITLLALVGVFLYMKINETEPALPEGVDSWTTGGLEIGGAASDVTVSTTTLPAYDASAAPVYSPGGAASTAAAPGDGAPPWTPSKPATTAIDATPKAEASLSATTDSSPIARSAEPQLPAMPALPGSAEKPAAAASTIADAPAFTAPPLGATASLENRPETAKMPTITPPSAVPSTPLDSTAPVAAAPTEPAADTPPTETKPAPTSVFPSVRVAVQGALDRGELAQALLLLSDWYDDPSLTAAESKEVNELLSQLAGSVIYEGPPAHRIEPAYIVQAGDALDDIAKKYDVPVQLLAKINGLPEPYSVQSGQELKVIQGPFSAILDISERKITLMLDRRYAGQFAIELDPTTTIEEGQWKVDQKLLSPGSASLNGPAGGGPTEDRSLLLANPTSATGQAAVLRGPGSADPIAAEPASRVIRLKSTDVTDVYDILSVGSRVTIRR